jgi:hypothetical protein
LYRYSTDLYFQEKKRQAKAYATDRDGNVLILFKTGFWFDLAKAPLQASSKACDNGCYAMSYFAGTHPHFAPEVTFGEHCGLAVDAFSVGIFIWEIMAMKERI